MKIFLIDLRTTWLTTHLTHYKGIPIRIKSIHLLYPLTSPLCPEQCLVQPTQSVYGMKIKQMNEESMGLSIWNQTSIHASSHKAANDPPSRARARILLRHGQLKPFQGKNEVNPSFIVSLLGDGSYPRMFMWYELTTSLTGCRTEQKHNQPTKYGSWQQKCSQRTCWCCLNKTTWCRKEN